MTDSLPLPKIYNEYVEPVGIKSSYAKHGLGKTLYNTVLKYKPKVILEIGVLHGYSTIAMAQALTVLGEGHIYACDLWEEYTYNHGTMPDVYEALDKYGVSHYVTCHKKTLESWLANPGRVDFLHVDVSNTGDIIEKVYNVFKPQIERGATMIFEGGSEERDQVEWITKYNKRPITAVKDFVPYEILDERWPSISIITNGYSNSNVE